MALIKIQGKANIQGKTIFDTGVYNPTDANAAAYIAAVEAADGAALEAPVKQAIDEFIIGCKADGIWNALKASCILAGARTLNGALVPLVGFAPTGFNFVSADYNRKTGLKGNTTNKYINTNRNNNSDPQNSKHIAVFHTESESNAGATVRTSLACANVTGSSFLGTSTTVRFTGVNGANLGAVDSTDTVGLFGASRSSSTQYIRRFNGNSYTVNNTSTTPANSVLGVFSRGVVGVSGTGDARISFYSIGESVDLTKLDTRVSSLMTALNSAI